MKKLIKDAKANIQPQVSAPLRIYRNKNFMKEFSVGDAIKEVLYKNDCVEVYECCWNNAGWSPRIHKYTLNELPEEKISNQWRKV